MKQWIAAAATENFFIFMDIVKDSFALRWLAKRSLLRACDSSMTPLQPCASGVA